MSSEIRSQRLLEGDQSSRALSWSRSCSAVLRKNRQRDGADTAAFSVVDWVWLRAWGRWNYPKHCYIYPLILQQISQLLWLLSYYHYSLLCKSSIFLSEYSKHQHCMELSKRQFFLVRLETFPLMFVFSLELNEVRLLNVFNTTM